MIESTPPNGEKSIIEIPIEKLRLDPDNPRLPEDLIGGTQTQLLEWLEAKAALDEIAASMLANGFFPHEPLVVQHNVVDDTFTVIEGNRRFATLLMLHGMQPAQEADLAFEFESSPSTEQIARLKQVPALVVSGLEEVRQFLGFRHIGGLKEWSPEAKARYLESEINASAASGSINPFRDIGRQVGSNAVGVRGPFIALQVIRAARDEYRISDAAVVMRERFGVWTRLLNSAEVRSFIGLGDDLDYQSVMGRLDKLDSTGLRRVVGDLVAQPGTKRPILEDSRDATIYGRVIGHEAARETLFAHGDLELASQVADRSSLGSKIGKYIKSVEVILNGIDTYDVDSEALQKSQSLSSVARSLAAVVKDRFDEEN
jgi:hypothetical protein